MKGFQNESDMYRSLLLINKETSDYISVNCNPVRLFSGSPLSITSFFLGIPCCARRAWHVEALSSTTLHIDMRVSDVTISLTAARTTWTFLARLTFSSICNNEVQQV